MKRTLFWELEYNDGFAVHTVWFESKEDTLDFIEALLYGSTYLTRVHAYTNPEKSRRHARMQTDADGV